MAGNHRSGRRPKSSAAKRAAGNPGKRKLGVEPTFDALQIEEPPAWLGKHGKAEWRRIVPQLLREHTLSAVDVPALEGYCAAYERAISCEAQIKSDGPMTQDEGGRIIKHPLLPVVAAAWREVRAFASEFGLTPATRSKVARHTGESSADPLSEFASQKNGAA